MQRHRIWQVVSCVLFGFGGLPKRSWRSNDSSWGRLDAVRELTETLLASQLAPTWRAGQAIAELEGSEPLSFFGNAYSVPNETSLACASDRSPRWAYNLPPPLAPFFSARRRTLPTRSP